MVSSMALLSSDIDEIAITEFKLKDIIDKLADVVCYWNCNVIYKKTREEKDLEGNCQDFVDSLFKIRFFSSC